MPFTATSRIPTRPLSYDNVDLAVPKEVVIDYKTGEVYVKKDDGELVAITSAIIEKIREQFEQGDTSFGDDITITIGDQVVKISAKIIEMLGDIELIKEMLKKLGIRIDNIEGGETKIIIEIKAGDIVMDEHHQWLTQPQKLAASAVFMLTTTVKGGEENWDGEEAPFTQKVIVPEMKESYYPIIDVKLSQDYEASKKELEDYACVYKVETYDGYVVCFASKIPEGDFNIYIKCDEPVSTLYPDPEPEPEPEPEPQPDPEDPEEPEEPDDPDDGDEGGEEEGSEEEKEEKEEEEEGDEESEDPDPAPSPEDGEDDDDSEQESKGDPVEDQP